MRDTEARCVGVALVAEFRCGGFAHHDRARVLQPRHQDIVLRRNVVGEDRRSVRRAYALGGKEILDVDRDAVQRPKLLARHDGPLCDTRLRPRRVGGHRRVGI